jgi:hypothetical protein
LKLLYTGLTRCRSRLYFVETTGRDARNAAFGWMKQSSGSGGAPLAEDLMNDDDFSSPQMATGAQVRRGCELMVKAVGSREMEFASCQQLIRQAIKLFEKAGISTSGGDGGSGSGGGGGGGGGDDTFYDLIENAKRHLRTRQIIADRPIDDDDDDDGDHGDSGGGGRGGGGDKDGGGTKIFTRGKGNGGKGGGGGVKPGAAADTATASLWDVKASRHVEECIDHGMYSDALQLVMLTTLGEDGEDGAIAKYLRDEIQRVAKRAAFAVTNAYSAEVGGGGE